MDDLITAAREFDRSRDALVLEKPIRHGDVTLEPGSRLPAQDFSKERLEQLIRVRFVKVVPGGASVSVASSKRADQSAVPADGGIACDECGRQFKTKTNLGAHRRAHRKG